MRKSRFINKLTTEQIAEEQFYALNDNKEIFVVEISADIEKNEEITYFRFLTDEDKNTRKRVEQEKVEYGNKSRRTVYMDAYRKYQAAVNYGEFQRAPVVDSFIAALCTEDWTVFENAPSELKYFIGEIGLAESGLELKRD